jgi:hypothetical protein
MSDLLCPDCGHHLHRPDPVKVKCQWYDCQCGITPSESTQVDEIRAALLSFDVRHHLDWFSDISGCETCGPEYDVNCSCGWSAEGYNSTSQFRDHIREAMGGWLGDDVPLTDYLPLTGLSR